jgi:hypothetical protein
LPEPGARIHCAICDRMSSTPPQAPYHVST